MRSPAAVAEITVITTVPMAQTIGRVMLRPRSSEPNHAAARQRPH
jgi:hypothetical protein